MTQADIRDMFRAVDGSDWQAMARHLHPDLVYDRPGFDLLVGREAVLHFYREVRSIRGEHRFDAIVVDDVHGACWGRFVGSRQDGTPIDLQFADCYTFSDGLLFRRKSFFYVPLA